MPAVVSIRALRSRGWLTITVEDDGPGIPPDKREEVFRPFHSLNKARNQDTKSSGLGLAIARDIVRGHGGEIVLGGSVLGGLKAVIRIPIQPGSEKPAIPAQGTRGKLTPLPILIVEPELEPWRPAVPFLKVRVWLLSIISFAAIPIVLFLRNVNPGEQLGA